MNFVKKQDIVDFLKESGYDFSLKGDVHGFVEGFSSILNYMEGTITWIKTLELGGGIPENISVCVVEEGIEVYAETIIKAKNSKTIFFEILNHFFMEANLPQISKDSTVETHDIGENCYIGHHCFIGKDVKIGKNVIIKNNVSIECPAIIGDNCIISSGTVIGTDGFGYFNDKNGDYKHVPHFGGVQIGKNVEVGSNTCIDRGTIDDTIIGDNVKIDNLCHIAHNVNIGENSLVIALSMLGGSSHIGRDAYIAPGCLIKNQTILEEHSFVGMGAVVIGNVERNKVVIGVPARVLRDNI